MTIDAALLARFSEIVGERHALTAPDEIAPYEEEPRGLFGGKTPLVLRPGSVNEVSAILRLASETGTAVVPQGGNTGLVGGQMPDGDGNEIVLSLSRLNQIREIDLQSNTATVEAGVVLQVLQDAVAEKDRLFPLSLGSQGSCQIGGNLSSNAGGVGALAYGTARDLCLGVEVVLPSGEVFDDLRKLKKDNTGYDLKDLFVGGEGTLGVITAAVVKLFPMPKGRELAWAALPSPADALRFFEMANDRAGNGLTAFELIERTPLAFTLAHVPGAVDPLEEAHPWYVMIEISSGRSADDAKELMEEILTVAFEEGLVVDAAIAQNEGQANAFRHLRESMSEAQKPEGGSIKHDISVPVSDIPAFIERAGPAAQKVAPGCRVVCFGHMGDGNLHYNISQPEGGDKQAYLALYREMNDAIHAIVRDLNGSFSAEHGIGRMKRDELVATQPAIATELMRRVKAAFDPAGIMNPHKVI
ncbi:FAD-binding oxidoreductase [Nitratireductor aquimarinus]|uniref:FAD-binding oxidoreductase n=1 Tax=Nitratireductor aquimarinus TaxID=889300 RepID=UPI001A8DDD18|nr:FAD-binding oxidoreductase [Nitratireductor aquimarinus]MBN8242104.1 FAD-binding oxidoreductase [Nitratireductor aquimarinus]MBY6130490.1 FAD-binding oxidoreductase [Nitratireductor aquimarinus]MCA1302755.1 FAD-binding oxidoreductase [Nitratireductor aquimarinus]